MSRDKFGDSNFSCIIGSEIYKVFLVGVIFNLNISIVVTENKLSLVVRIFHVKGLSFALVKLLYLGKARQIVFSNIIRGSFHLFTRLNQFVRKGLHRLNEVFREGLTHGNLFYLFYGLRQVLSRLLLRFSNGVGVLGNLSQFRILVVNDFLKLLLLLEKAADDFAGGIMLVKSVT